MELTREELRLIEHMRKNCVSEECDEAIVDYVIERGKEAIDVSPFPAAEPSDTELLDWLIHKRADLREGGGKWSVLTFGWEGPCREDAREAIRAAMRRTLA